MKETQEILNKMGFVNTKNNVWEVEWFGYLFLAKSATPEDLAKFLFEQKGIRH